MKQAPCFVHQALPILRLSAKLVYVPSYGGNRHKLGLSEERLSKGWDSFGALQSGVRRGMADDSAIARLNDMIGDIQIAMLATMGTDGNLHSRPLATQKVQDDGTVFFFTGVQTTAAFESEENCRVNVSYVDPRRSVYISIAGIASVSDDRRKIHELWDPVHSAWFPKGMDDPDLRLLCVQIERAEYWDVATNALSLLVGYARKTITGKADGIGTHERLV